MPQGNLTIYGRHLRGNRCTRCQCPILDPGLDRRRSRPPLRKEAATWIAARSKAPCKTLDDLKKIKGIDFTKIDARRDRLVCF
jgi:hypothetical protein